MIRKRAVRRACRVENDARDVSAVDRSGAHRSLAPPPHATSRVAPRAPRRGIADVRARFRPPPRPWRFAPETMSEAVLSAAPIAPRRRARPSCAPSPRAMRRSPPNGGARRCTAAFSAAVARDRLRALQARASAPVAAARDPAGAARLERLTRSLGTVRSRKAAEASEESRVGVVLRHRRRLEARATHWRSSARLLRDGRCALLRRLRAAHDGQLGTSGCSAPPREASRARRPLHHLHRRRGRPERVGRPAAAAPRSDRTSAFDVSTDANSTSTQRPGRAAASRGRGRDRARPRRLSRCSTPIAVRLCEHALRCRSRASPPSGRGARELDEVARVHLILGAGSARSSARALALPPRELAAPCARPPRVVRPAVRAHRLAQELLAAGRRAPGGGAAARAVLVREQARACRSRRRSNFSALRSCTRPWPTRTTFGATNARSSAWTSSRSS